MIRAGRIRAGMDLCPMIFEGQPALASGLVPVRTANGRPLANAGRRTPRRRIRPWWRSRRLP